MSDPKDNSSFFRKVVKFVANPATDWTQLDAPTQESRDTEYAKSELKAMIERKKRNDFVRKREFDMLRKVRREGLTSEQLAALGDYANLDDSEARLADSQIRAEGGVKAKIDEIEQQMVGDQTYSAASARRRPPNPQIAPTEPAAMPYTPTVRGTLDSLPSAAAAVPVASAVPPAGAALVPFSPAAESQPYSEPTAFANAFSVEVSDVVHDPELDEAVIAFANADYEQCEQALVALTSAGGARAQHAETWLVLFDFYRATARQSKFESLALDYAQQFGWSAPQWYSLPKLVADAAAGQARPPRTHIDGHIGWVCPAVLDADGVADLAAQTQHMPLPWVFDWSVLTSLDVAACARLGELFRSWIMQPIDMRWIGGDRLFEVLQEATQTGASDADPVCWQLRLDALRMIGRADQFDEVAIDYCITYEVSPPSWEPARCRVRLGGEAGDSSPTNSGLGGEPSRSFLESMPFENHHAPAAAADSVELTGQLTGDIGETLARLDQALTGSTLITIVCTRLIRVDFTAAGDLLNWVLTRQGEQRSVTFTEAHRLVALFFGAMGINEHARVRVRSV